IRAADRETLTALGVAAAKGPGEARQVCVRALGRSGTKDAVAPLLPLLKDAALRADACASLMRIDQGQGERVAAALAPDLAGDDEAVRKRTLTALAAMRPPPDAIVEPLLPLLGDEKSAQPACEVLEECRAEALRPAIASLVAML